MSPTRRSHSRVSEPQPLVNEPALTVGSTLVLADLHIGIEHELALSGINIPSQVDRRIDRVLRYLATTNAQRVVLLGDVKHTISKTSALERHDIPRFLRSLAECAPVDILPGNHDAGIEYWLPRDSRFRIEIHPSKGCSINGAGLLHGHTWPSSDLLHCDYVIMGITIQSCAWLIRSATSVRSQFGSGPALLRAYFESDIQRSTTMLIRAS